MNARNSYDIEQLRDMTGFLQTEAEEAAVRAVPHIEAAHAALKSKAADYNERHRLATHDPDVSRSSARKVAELVAQQENAARQEAYDNLYAKLKEAGVSEAGADSIASYLKNMIVREGRQEGGDICR